MYGYVRPEKGEMKMREYEAFRGVYCALCHELRGRYGTAFRFAVNYDLTFLAMLLAGQEQSELCPRRCPYHPLRKTPCPTSFPALSAAADYTVILAWWKLRDGERDKGTLGRAGCRILRAIMTRAYKKAAALRPDFARAAEENLLALAALEEEKCPGIDQPADKFAKILQAAAEGADTPERARILRELLYHLGRIVYLLDAADDLAADERSGAYNPLHYRFALQDGKLTPEDEKALRLTLEHSHNCVCAAYELLAKNPYEGVLTNTIYFGLPAVTQAVFSGTWRASQKQKRNRSNL